MEGVVILVVNVGAVPKTKAPEPVSPVTERATFADEMELVNCPPVVVENHRSTSF